jgi:hypothetical protein
MKHSPPIALIVATLVLLMAGFASAQSIYNERVLRAIGLDDDEVSSILEVDERVSADIRRYQADREIKQAELARLLLDESPNMRQVERNLRDAAEIEVQIRLLEIERELAIREVVGADRWSSIIQTIRARRDEVAEQTAAQAAALRERMSRIQQELAARQREILRQLESGGAEAEDRVREELQEIQQRFRELQELMQNRE